MAKQLWFTSVLASTHRSNNNAKLDGVSQWWNPFKLSEARGSGVTSASVTSVLGATNGIEVFVNAGISTEWLSEPLSADFTIAGTITANLWAYETNMTDNAAVNFLIERMDGATGTLTQIVKSTNVVELASGGSGSSTANNFTATPTSTACHHGDRLRIRVFMDDVGTMAAGGLLGFQYAATAAAGQGDSWIQFTENLTFETTAPTGSTYYLTDTAASINPGSATEKVASTTRGSGSVNAVTNTATGPTAGIQTTDSAGGTAIEWYTPPLNAVSLGGMAQLNIRALATAAANASLKAEIAVTANDGTAAVVWGIALIDASLTIGTSDAAKTAWVAGDDTSVSAGQRLRFRLYVDDAANVPLVTGKTVTVSYSGTSAAAAGDTYVILPVTVTEQAASAASLLWAPTPTVYRM